MVFDNQSGPQLDVVVLAAFDIRHLVRPCPPSTMAWRFSTSNLDRWHLTTPKQLKQPTPGPCQIFFFLETFSSFFAALGESRKGRIHQFWFAQGLGENCVFTVFTLRIPNSCGYWRAPNLRHRSTSPREMPFTGILLQPFI